MGLTDQVIREFNHDMEHDYGTVQQFCLPLPDLPGKQLRLRLQRANSKHASECRDQGLCLWPSLRVQWNAIGLSLHLSEK